MADLVEDFEDTTYVVPISGTWDRSNARAHTGTWSFKSAVIGDGQSTEAVFTVPTGAATVTFWRRLSSELSHDYLRFFLDSTQQFASSGDVDWILSPTYNVSAVSTITFRYSKDGSLSVGDDAAYIDDVTFTFPPTEGSQTCVIGTEHTLTTLTAPGIYQVRVDTAALAGGDVLEVRVYAKCRNATDSERLQQVAHYGPTVADQKLIESILILATGHYRVTLKQVAGTGRAFPWVILDSLAL